MIEFLQAILDCGYAPIVQSEVKETAKSGIGYRENKCKREHKKWVVKLWALGEGAEGEADFVMRHTNLDCLLSAAKLYAEENKKI